MPIAAQVLRGNASTRYMVKEIEAPLGRIENASPVWVLTALEEQHEDGWDVCGVTQVGHSIWVFYQRSAALH